MTRILTTGPVENAAGNSSVSTWIKVLNNHDSQSVRAEITVFSLNGTKNPIGSAVLEVAPLTSQYETFDIADVLQFEVQIALSSVELVYVSVWGKDANANLVPAHRFVPSELSTLIPASTATRKKPASRPASPSRRRRI